MALHFFYHNGRLNCDNSLTIDELEVIIRTEQPTTYFVLLQKLRARLARLNILNPPSNSLLSVPMQ